MQPQDRLTILSYIVCALVVGALFGLLLRGVQSTLLATQPPKPYQPSTPQSSTPTARLQHPLTIQALSNRSYGEGLISVERKLADRATSTVRVISYPSDGNKINALLLTPKQPQPVGGYPVVILAHGFLPGEQYKTEAEEYLGWADVLTAAGFIVVKPDYRGHDQSWGSQESAYYSPGYVHDVLNLAASMQKYHQVNPKKIGALGHSLGGQVVLKAAISQPNLISAVGLAASSSGTATEIYSTGFPSENHTGISPSARESLFRVYGTPTEDSPFWRSTSPLYALDRLSGGVWVAHCSDDQNVPKWLSDQLTDKAKAAGKSTTYFQCESGGHGFGGAAIEPFNASLREFFTAQLK